MSYAPTIVSHMTLPGPSDSRPVTSSRAAEDPALARTRTQDRYGRAVSKRVKYNQVTREQSRTTGGNGCSAERIWTTVLKLAQPLALRLTH